MPCLRWVLLALLLCTVGTNAHAENAAVAREHYKKATVLFDLQKYSEAALEYEAAYEAKPDPALLFNTGQAYGLAMEYTKAIRAFRSYLRRAPTAPNRGEAEQRIAEMQKAMTEKPMEPKPEPKPEPVAPPPAVAPAPVVVAPPPGPNPEVAAQARRTKIIGLAVGASGIAVLAAGIGFSVAARRAFNEIDMPSPNYVFNPTTQRNLHVFEPLGGALIGVGLAAMTVGTTLYVLGWEKSRPAARHARRDAR